MRTNRMARGDRGTTIVELSIVVIAFFIIIIGILDVGRGVWAYNSLAAAARAATRHAIVHGDRSATPVSSNDIEDYVKSKLPGMSGLVVTTVWDPDNSQGSLVRVTVQYPFQPVIGVFQAVTLRGVSEMAISY